VSLIGDGEQGDGRDRAKELVHVVKSCVVRGSGENMPDR